MRIIIHPLAQKEFERKIRWLKKYGYLVDSAGAFHHEIEAALSDLAGRTHHREIVRTPGYYRFGPTPTFRYSLIYKIVETHVHLVAMAAPERRPGYWKRRKT
jgi:hypothetical protein